MSLFLRYGFADQRIITSPDKLKKEGLREVGSPLAEKDIEILHRFHPFQGAALMKTSREKRHDHFFRVINRIESLLLFCDLLRMTGEKTYAQWASLIHQWMRQNLSEEDVFYHASEIETVLQESQFKLRYGDSRKIQVLVAACEDLTLLPRERARKMQRNRLRNGIVDVQKEQQVIRGHRLGLKDIKPYLYRLSQKDRIRLIHSALSFTPTEHLNYLMEVLETIPEKILQQSFKNVSVLEAYYFHPDLRERLVDHSTVILPPLPFPVFVDGSLSMGSYKHEVEWLYHSYLKGSGAPVSIVTDEVRIWEGDYHPVSRSSYWKALLENPSPIKLFITDGNFDEIELEREVASVGQTWIVWDIKNRTGPAPGNKHIIYCYAPLPEEAELMVEFLTDMNLREKIDIDG